MERLLTKEYFSFMFFRIVTILSMLAAIFFVMIDLEIVYSVLLFVLSFFSTIMYSRYKPIPKLATCLDGCSTICSVSFNIFLNAGIGFLLFIFLDDQKIGNIDSELTMYISISVIMISSIFYMFKCKKQGVFDV